MKQLPMTTELIARIHAAVGPDVETEGMAVFEAIALNTKPLPGKDGTLFQDAMIMPLTLQQMAMSIENGNHIPLISDHQLTGEPKGRAFSAGLAYSEDGSIELRVLFYLDATEARLIEKLNAGSLDEVSVSFLSTQFLCSECSWDYFGPEASSENFYSKTCANGHTIGEDGVHAQLVGLETFIELSLVARGAANNPKIVGQSASKLQPATKLRLAASGYEIDGLVCRAGTGEDPVSTPDFTKLVTDLVASTTSVATLTASNTTLTTSLTAAEASVASLTAALTAMTGERDAALAAPTSEADYQVALAFLTEVNGKVMTAAGVELAEADAPKSVADLKASIVKHTSNLTAILPVGGVAQGVGDHDKDSKPTLVLSAFSNRTFGK